MSDLARRRSRVLAPVLALLLTFVPATSALAQYPPGGGGGGGGGGEGGGGGGGGAEDPPGNGGGGSGGGSGGGGGGSGGGSGGGGANGSRPVAETSDDPQGAVLSSGAERSDTIVVGGLPITGAALGGVVAAGLLALVTGALIVTRVRVRARPSATR